MEVRIFFPAPVSRYYLQLHQEAQHNNTRYIVVLEELADGLERFGNRVADSIAGQLQPLGDLVMGKPLYPAHGEHHFALGRKLVDGLVNEVLVFAVEEFVIGFLFAAGFHFFANEFMEAGVAGGHFEKVECFVMGYFLQKCVEVADILDEFAPYPQFDEDIDGDLFGDLAGFGNPEQVIEQLAVMLVKKQFEGLLIASSNGL